MNRFTAKVALKSAEELENIVKNAIDYQDEFLEAVRQELNERQLDIESPLLDQRLAKKEKIKESQLYQEKALETLPAGIKWAANLIYLSLILRFVELIRVNLSIEVSGLDATYFFVFLSFGLMMFIASTIRKGRDIRKLLAFMVFFSIIQVVTILISFLTVGALFLFTAGLFASLCEILALMLLYIGDSREWYGTEGKQF